jgi:hypothetical protein
LKRVYLETSFFSACVWTRTDTKSLYWQQQSRLWWSEQRHFYELFHSAEVLRELADPQFKNREEALALATEPQLLELNDKVFILARLLVQEKVMPGPEDGGDAVHVAVATVFGIDFVVTWNQRHLANRNKIPHLREVCRRAGYTPPDIATPEELWILPGEVGST